MKLPFVKMHGTGNDFVVVERNCLPSDADLSVVAQKACNRKYGIGSDGLILIGEASNADFEMIFYNPDGSLAEMCGNGIRCLGKYVYEHGLTKKTSQKILTKAGIIDLELGVGEDGKVSWVEVSMGKPNFKRKEIPVKGEGATAFAEIIELPNGLELEFHAVAIGNPHAVILVDDWDSYLIHEVGPLVENHDMFPNRINVEFVKYVSPDLIKVRTWERGAGETMSCGTGVCASAAVLKRLGLTGDSVRVGVLGGELEVRFGRSGIIYLKGPAVEVFSGIIEI